jgi:two-component system sensor histidine kinase/response regulator
VEKINSVSQGPKIDLAELLSRVDNDLELLRDLALIFKDDFPRHLQVLRQAVGARDLKQVKVASHTIKGMLANLAVTRGAAAAAQLEQLAGNGAEDSLALAMSEFEREVEGLLLEMESRVEEVQS